MSLSSIFPCVHRIALSRVESRGGFSAFLQSDFQSDSCIPGSPYLLVHYLDLIRKIYKQEDDSLLDQEPVSGLLGRHVTFNMMPFTVALCRWHRCGIGFAVCLPKHRDLSILLVALVEVSRSSVKRRRMRFTAFSLLLKTCLSFLLQICIWISGQTE